MYNQRIGSNHRHVPGRYDIVLWNFGATSKSVGKVRAVDGTGWSTQRHFHFTLEKETWYPLYRRLGGPQGQLRKVSPPPGFDPRTIQPIASCYTSCAIPAHNKSILQRFTEGKIQGGIEMTGRQGRRHRKLLDDLKERRRYSHLKEEALDRTMWRARFGRGFGPVIRQTTK